MSIQTQSHASGSPFHCLETGSGPPLLLIHGLLGASFCWRLNIPFLAQRFTILAVDLPGFGESPAPSAGSGSIETQALQLLSWLQERGLTRIDVVASSWGGAVALFLAALSPQIVRSLVLAAPVNPWSDFGRGRVRFFSGVLGGALLRMGIRFSRPLHHIALQRMYGDPARIPAGTLEGYSRIMLRKGRARNLVQTLRSWKSDMDGLRGAVERVQSPTLLIWGSRDGAVDIGSADILRQKLPGCELAIIEGAGHLPFEETPEEFNRLVVEFIDRLGFQPSK